MDVSLFGFRDVDLRCGCVGISYKRCGFEVQMFVESLQEMWLGNRDSVWIYYKRYWALYERC